MLYHVFFKLFLLLIILSFPCFRAERHSSTNDILCWISLSYGRVVLYNGCRMFSIISGLYPLNDKNILTLWEKCLHTLPNAPQGQNRLWLWTIFRVWGMTYLDLRLFWKRTVPISYDVPSPSLKKYWITFRKYNLHRTGQLLDTHF